MGAFFHITCTYTQIKCTLCTLTHAHAHKILKWNSIWIYQNVCHAHNTIHTHAHLPNSTQNTHTHTQTHALKRYRNSEKCTEQIAFSFSIFRFSGNVPDHKSYFIIAFEISNTEYINEVVRMARRVHTVVHISKMCVENEKWGAKQERLNEVAQWSSQLRNPNRMHIIWATVNNSRNFLTDTW